MDRRQCNAPWSGKGEAAALARASASSPVLCRTCLWDKRLRPEGNTIESVHRMLRWLRNQVRTMPFTARAPTSLSVPLARMAARPVRPPCSGAYAALAVQTAGRSSTDAASSRHQGQPSCLAQLLQIQHLSLHHLDLCVHQSGRAASGHKFKQISQATRLKGSTRTEGGGGHEHRLIQPRSITCRAGRCCANPMSASASLSHTGEQWVCSRCVRCWPNGLSACDRASASHPIGRTAAACNASPGNLSSQLTCKQCAPVRAGEAGHGQAPEARHVGQPFHSVPAGCKQWGQRVTATARQQAGGLPQM